MMAARRGTTKTGGRKATDRFIPGEVALAVGRPPSESAPPGWTWRKLSDIARMESGHTPSRKHSEYWDGDIPWIGIRDAKAHHGETIADTVQATNELGIANSSARVLPARTVCLSRTASVGYVVVMGRPMATSQDFANWICSDELEPHFLKYLLLSEEKCFPRFASGATHQTIYYPELKAFHVCVPLLAEQKRTVAILDEAFAGIDAAVANAEKNLANARELFESHLNSAFESTAERWVQVRLDNLAAVFTDGDWVETKDQSPSGIRLIQTGNVGAGKFKNRPHKARYISEKTFSRLRCQEVSPGDCLISRLPDPVGRACIVPSIDERMITAVDCTIIRFKSGAVLPEFFVYYSRSRKYLAEVEKFCTGATRKRISRKNLGKILVPHPDDSEQERLIVMLDDLTGRTEQLERRFLNKLKEISDLRRSILNKAFSGELTAKEAEKEMAVA